VLTKKLRACCPPLQTLKPPKLPAQFTPQLWVCVAPCAPAQAAPPPEAATATL
jgi:hypothetical protein